jgi:hypothetical protein
MQHKNDPAHRCPRNAKGVRAEAWHAPRVQAGVIYNEEGLGGWSNKKKAA